jgi:aminoglycoside phosphotransferase family enzyme/predicted kinase
MGGPMSSEPSERNAGGPDASGVGPAAVVETHISTLVFMGDRVYKYKKPVKFGFLDFSTPELRRMACRNEVVLNRRLAPDVYLGIAEQLDEHGRPEFAVVMRRMDPGRRLAAMVTDRAAELNDRLAEVATLVAEFHRHAERSAAIDADATAAVIRREWDAGAEEMAPFVGPVLDPGVFDAVVGHYRQFIDGRTALFDQRIAAGHICDGHGDLQAEDVFCTPDGPRVLDCIEFDAHLRHCDVLADVAFMAMDLERLGDHSAGERFVASWAAVLGGDVVHPALLHHYIAERAFVRAKVACLRLDQYRADSPQAVQSADAARSLLALCAAHLEAGAPRLVLVGGSPGTGKTTVATGLGDTTGWPVLHSDVVRKQRLGLDPASRPSPDQSRQLYDPAEVAATYGDLLSAAAHNLTMGQSVVLDASWTSADERARARQVGAEAMADVLELQCVCDPDEARRRVADRLASSPSPGAQNPTGPSGAAGASDATPEVADLLASRTDPWPQAKRVDTQAELPAVVAAALAAVGPW